MVKNRAVFFDRDGTLIKEIDYKDGTGHYSPRKLSDVKFLPKVIKALQLLSKTDYKIVIVTNQSGIARGLYDEETLSKIHRKIMDTLEKKGVKISGIYYCPHRAEERCNCRKPNMYMLNVASVQLSIDLKSSFMVGNSATDIQTGINAGCKTIFVKSDRKEDVKGAAPDFIASDLYEAVKIIVGKK
jgi:D-glycero-D-manno-heptose 1,7-bisphosphate phosphatase